MQGVSEPWRFGPFEIRPDTGELLDSGRAVKLAPQPFLVLALIVRAGGSLVTREQLRDAVWAAEGTTVEFDQGLNYCIRQIRIALNDDARRPIYIETVPKRGYRLLVRAIPAANATPPPAADARRSLRRYIAVIMTAACITAVAGLVFAYRSAPPAISPEADRLFQEAESLAGTWETNKVSEAVKRYEEVLRLEPNFARAWAGLANADVVLTFMGPQPAQSLADSETHARHAIEVDGSLAVAHAALGHSYWHQWRRSEAEEEFRLAMRGGDNVAVVHQLFGLYLASVGRSNEAIEHARRAVALAPVSGVINYSLAQVYLQTGRFDAALAQAQRTLDIDRHFPLAYNTLLRANSQLGRMQEASEAFDAQFRFSPQNTAAWRAYLLARQSRPAEARAVLESERDGRSRPKNSIGEAAAFVAIGDVDAAFQCLDEAVAAHIPSLVWLQVTPELAPLHSDTRFAALLARIDATRSDGKNRGKG
jgi:DNA-binding winged helix-turn-helix (wHTH) protein/tetratricopeptide (TPR) repeat protein